MYMQCQLFIPVINYFIENSQSNSIFHSHSAKVSALKVSVRTTCDVSLRLQTKSIKIW